MSARTAPAAINANAVLKLSPTNSFVRESVDAVVPKDTVHVGAALASAAA